MVFLSILSFTRASSTRSRSSCSFLCSSKTVSMLPPLARTCTSRGHACDCRLTFDPCCTEMAMDGFVLNEERYLRLLEKLIGETEFLQDNPPKFVPQEDKYVWLQQRLRRTR